MFKANYHTHVLYCNHAEGHCQDYIDEAIAKGLVEIGITDHAPVLECMMTKEEYAKTWSYQPMKLDTMYRDYLKEVALAKKDNEDKIKVLSGFETEYLPRNEFFLKLLFSKVDYLNLGIHFFEYQGKILNSYDDITYETIEGYQDACVKGMKTGLFNTLVHPDLFMFGYKDKDGKRHFDEICYDVSKTIIETAIAENVYLEINANGIRNSKRFSNREEWLYPCLEFWKIVAEYPQAKIIIGSDAHRPQDLVNENIDQVIKFVNRLGLKVEERMELNHTYGKNKH